MLFRCCLSVVTLVLATSCAFSGGEESASSADNNSPPLLCESCASGGDTTDFGGVTERDRCVTDEHPIISTAEALERGYDVEGFIAMAEGAFSAPVRWDGDESPFQLTASIAVRELSLGLSQSPSGTQCLDALFLQLSITLNASDSSIVGQLVGKSAITSTGELASPLLIDLHSWSDDLRGTTQLVLSEAALPQALLTHFVLLIPNTEESPRLSLEILGLYERDLALGNPGHTISLRVAEPVDGCPASSRPGKDDCSDVTPP